MRAVRITTPQVEGHPSPAAVAALVGISGGYDFETMGSQLVRSAAKDLCASGTAATAAARFHKALAVAVVAACRRPRETAHRLGTVALSGGVFQNVLLGERAISGLDALACRVVARGRVPTNGGGISPGQAAVAGPKAGHGGYDLPW